MTVDVTEQTTANVTEQMTAKYHKIEDVLAQVHAAGIVSADIETIEYHLHRTRKMPKPAKTVKRERYWTKDQINQFIDAL